MLEIRKHLFDFSIHFRLTGTIIHKIIIKLKIWLSEAIKLGSKYGYESNTKENTIWIEII